MLLTGGAGWPHEIFRSEFAQKDNAMESFVIELQETIRELTPSELEEVAGGVFNFAANVQNNAVAVAPVNIANITSGTVAGVIGS
jgi:hypothetical protein